MANPFDNTTYPTQTPECIVIGRHIGWRIRNDDADADYTLKYVLNKIGATSSDTPIEISGTRTEIDGVFYWVFEVDTATSTGWTLATDTEYRWDLVMVRNADNNEAVTITGFIWIFQTISDRRTHAEKMLIQIEALLEGRVLNDVDSYSIKTRSISKMSVKDLLYWRDYYREEVNRTGGSTSSGRSKPKNNTILIGFQ